MILILRTDMIQFLPIKEITEKYQEEIKNAVNRVVDSGWYILGKEVESFERNYSEYIGTKHCIGCANGLDSLSLIFRAYIQLGVLKRGDEVIVPANTYIATILSITENGLIPVLVEPTLSSLEIDERQIETVISSNTKAILIVHLYGRCAFSPVFRDICDNYNLILIEDNAQAHGCRASDGRRTGSLGDAAGHSFYPGKNLGALGDGGAVTTDDPELADVVRSLANYGSSKKYVFPYRGRNSRLDEIQAAVLNVKLLHLDEDNAHRATIARLYYEQLASLPGITLPTQLPDDQNVYHLFPILCDRRDELQQYLTENNIQTLIHYPIPPHKQQCYAEWNILSFPITEYIADHELSLPIGPVILGEDAHEVVSVITHFNTSQ